MIPPCDTALACALALRADPTLALQWRRQPLPAGMSDVIQAASGATDAVARNARSLGVSVEELIAASRTYLQSVVLHADAGSRRLLGLHADDDADVMRRHYRWLQSWLHPDRAADATASARNHEALVRINAAWQQLSTGPVAIDAASAVAMGGHDAVVLVRDPVPLARPYRWVIPTMVCVFCIWLVVLAVRQESEDAQSPTSLGAMAYGADHHEAVRWTSLLGHAASTSVVATDPSVDAPMEEVNNQHPPSQPDARLPAAQAPGPDGPIAAMPAARPAQAAVEVDAAPSQPWVAVQTVSPSSVATMSIPDARVDQAPVIASTTAITPAAQASVATQTAAGIPSVRSALPLPALTIEDKQKLAQARMQVVQQFLADPAIQVSAIWADAATASSANAVRRQLHAARASDAGIRFVAVDNMVQADSAVFRVRSTRLDGDSSMPVLLEVGMRWQDNGWQVRSVQVAHP